MSLVTENDLRQLRAGDRLKYHGVLWAVHNFSTFMDVNGYETEEWLIKSQTGKMYYLLREVDPNNPTQLVHWYIAEELRDPAIYEPESSRDLVPSLASRMRSQAAPYPALRLFNRLYSFESQTYGDYHSKDGSELRITWDYWDETHLWNLALEVWSNDQLVVYSTREVQPTDFTDIQKGLMRVQVRSDRAKPAITGRTIQFILAWFITVLGFVLMISGI